MMRSTAEVRRSLADVVAPSFRLHVNVLARSFSFEAMAKNFATLDRYRDLDLHGLGLEITEQAVIGDHVVASRGLQQVRDLGISIALDDFGTGASSLSLVRELPIHALKIDRRFVRTMLEEPADAAVVAAVIELGHRLGLTVTAEGVETEAQLARLRALGADHAQGFLFSPAVPPEDLRRLLLAGPSWSGGRLHRSAAVQW